VLIFFPCPILDSENSCTIYPNLPTAFKEDPHTNRKRFHQILDIALKSTFICPAVYGIAKELNKQYLN